MANPAVRAGRKPRLDAAEYKRLEERQGRSGSVTKRCCEWPI